MTLNRLTELITDLKEKEALEAVQTELKNQKEPLEIIDACRKGMESVGKKFQTGEYFLPDLIVSGELFKEIMEEIKPYMKKEKGSAIGKIVLGTVKDDVHDIGKDIFKNLAEANGFEVYDLGVDVPPEKFVECIKKENPQIVGMSCLLTSAFSSIELTMNVIKKEGLRDKVKVIIGGAPVNEELKEKIGCDAQTRNASEGVELCKKFLKEMGC